MHHWKTTALVVMTCALAACTTTGPQPSTIPQKQVIAKKSSDTVTTASVSPVQVPSDLSADNIQGTFAVPDTTMPVTQQQQPQTQAQTQTVATAPATPPGSNMPQKPAKPNLSTSIAAAESATISGRVGLSLQMPYSQAWTRVGQALPKAGYPVMEQDAGSGTYYVLDKVGSGGVIKRDTPIYQLRLQKASDNKTVGTLINSQNQPADSAVSQRILGAVKRSI